MHRKLYVLKGENYLRIFIIFILSCFGVFALLAINFLGFISFYIIFLTILGIVCVRFPKLVVYENYFEIEKECLIKKYSDIETYKYEEIISVEFVKGNTKWIKLIFQVQFVQHTSERFSKPDQLIINLKNGKQKFIYRFGTERNFIEAIAAIDERIKPSN